MKKEDEYHEPVLLSKDHGEDKVNPPYILIALVLFGVLGAFWKMAIRKDEDATPAPAIDKSIKPNAR